MYVKNEVYPERWFLRRSDVRSVVQVQLELLVNDNRLCLGATAGCSHHVPLECGFRCQPLFQSQLPASVLLGCSCERSRS